MIEFKPSDPNFDARVRASFARQQVMQTLGITIARLVPGEIELGMPYIAAYTQQHGFMHAGIITAALDSACGYAAFSLMPAHAEILTVEFKTNLLARPRASVLRFAPASSSPDAPSRFVTRRLMRTATAARSWWRP